MRRSTAFTLLAIALLAIFIRLLPVTQYLYWGGDFGEYFGLTRTLAQGQPLPDPYLGWGVTYAEFPGMYVLTASISWTGIPLEAAAVLLVPILSALTVVPVFLLVRELTGKDWPSLLAAAIVAVVSPHVYATSHPIPGALADLLFVTGLLLVVRLRSDVRFLGLLIPIGLALAPIHHLSSYFLIIATFFVAFFRIVVLGSTWKEVRRESLFLVFLVAVNVAYWVAYAETFRAFLGFERVPPALIAGLLVALPLFLYPLSRVRERLTWQYRPRYPPPARAWTKILLAAVVATGILVTFSLLWAPGTSIPTAQATLLYALPYLPLFLLGAAGRKPFDFLPQGTFVTGAFIAFNLSWIIGAGVAPTILIPYRHLQYLTPLIAAFAAGGAILLIRKRRARWIVVLILGGLIVLAAAVALPPREAVGNHFEGTRPQALGAMHWAVDRIPSITATDHRVSSILFGFTGVLGTWDKVSAPLHAPTFEEARGEMEATEERARIDFILLDADLLLGATLFPWEPALPLSAEAQAKFQGEHYLKLYDDGYAQVYWVNWGVG